MIHTRTQHPGTLLSVINGTARQVIEKALLTLPLTQGRDGLCSGEGRAAPAPAPPPLCLSSKPRHARGGKRHGILRARLDRACRPWLESKARQRSPSPSLGARCGDGCRAPPRRPAFTAPLTRLGVVLQKQAACRTAALQISFSLSF